jgi:hypothetical protein
MRFPCPKPTSFKRRKSALKPRGQLEAQNRPCLTINRLPQFVNQVADDRDSDAIIACSGRKIPLSARTDKRDSFAWSAQ